MKRLIPLGCVLLLATWFAGVLFAAYDYSISIRVVNNSGEYYNEGLPVLITLNNSQLYDLGYIVSTGTDTNVEEGGVDRGYTVVDDSLGVFFSTLQSYQTRTLSYRLGQDPQQTEFPLIVGVGGTVTVTDDADLEIGDNFTIKLTGYIDFLTAGNLTSKEDSFSVDVADEDGVINATLEATTFSTASTGYTWPLYSGSYTRAGANITSLSAGVYPEVSFQLSKQGGPTGTYVARAYRVSDGAFVGEWGSGNSAALNGVPTWHSFNSTAVTNPTTQAMMVVVEYANGNGSNYIRVDASTTDQDASFVGGYYTTVWTNDAPRDPDLILLRKLTVGSGPGHVSGTYEINITGNGTDFAIDVDDVAGTSEAFNGDSANDNGNDWVLGSDALLTVDSYTHDVDGIQEVRFEVNTMIGGTTLTDREGGDHNGVIAWGSNPAGIEVTVQGLTSAISVTSGVVTNETTPDLLGSPPAIIYMPSVSDEDLVDMPLYLSVNQAATSLGMTTEVLYVILIEMVALAMGAAGLVALGSAWGFAGGFGFANALAIGTPVSPIFFMVVLGFIIVLGAFTYRRLA